MKHTIWIGLVMRIISAYTGRASTPQNAEFIALYQAIINGGLTEPEGSGKAAAATATVSAIAQNTLSANSSLAQSILAVYNHADYIRHGEPVNLKSANIRTLPDFDIMPNPASSSVNLSFRKPVSESCHLLVYRINGQLVLTVKVPASSQQLTLNIENLQSGIYFCKLNSGTNTAKLVIVK